MGKTVKTTRSRSVKIKVVRRGIFGPAKVSYLSQGLPQPNSKQTNPTITSQPAEPDDVSPNCSSESAYSRAKKRELHAWDAVKDDMLKVSFECSAPIATQCVVCLAHADYRCIECSTTAVFCESCLKRTHRNSLHLSDKWNNVYYEPSSLGLFLYLPEGHSTHAVYTKDMKVIVSTGRLCTVTVNMCACEPETCTLLRYGLWPATADKPQTAFSITLLELFVCLSLECQVSVEGFCNTMRWKNNLTLAEVNTLYRALVGESISHFRHHHFRQRSLVDICPKLDDGTKCPACPKAAGDMIVTLDANFGLVRKQSSGTSAVEPLHGTRMFVNENDVEEYLLSHLDSSEPHEDCSNFKAGNVLRSQKQAKKLDVTGVFGASCRHEMPLMFVNMSQGERLAYPLYVIDELLRRCEDKNIHLRIVYDIACVVASHLHKLGKGIPHNISLAIPAFHVYGHKLPCQIKYSTRRLDGFGLTDGEGMERLWSFLRRFARVTKEMTPSHRLDLLTDALLHYGRRKSTDLEMQLLQRLDRAEKISILAQEDISSVIREAPVLVSEGDMEKWKKREMELAQQKQKPISTVCRWKRDYIIKLIQFYKFKIEDSLLNIEKKHRIGRRWQESDSDFQSTLKNVDCELRGQLIFKARTESRERAVLLHLKRKYPDGQGIAIRLSKQIASSNKRLRQAINEYNRIQWPPQRSIFPTIIDFQEACDPSWQVYFCFDDTIEDDNVSRSLKRRAIDAINMKTRATEEKGMLYQEMRNITEHLHQQHAFLCSAIKDTDQPGAKAALTQRLHQVERKRHQATVMFHTHVQDIVPVDNPYLCQALPMSSIETLVYNEDGDDDNEDDTEDDHDN
ncbi:uncharacterized protein LOC120488660 isoform X1 [Pimephales promelas]|uniref:uncharacterized protein LOC120473823 isoform X2 n=1 Tax=Pimephales promelas TaxID=90988 RepID=UPI001955D93C|nr:uncharacterized protein LOC120473823 isoform X2 [Pimephales promelas]XP_039537564.1 uncharacterized protein LOC120485855 isoform X2 [Pimephales promelas]XP_039541210.1 uncharacterized protein LOC120488660 isoform X1 [Pimephales promelas]KAG1930605.1 hypothetical protein F2P79_022169 [Pimephales promelas]KAG1930606.1 hypothetical protein F2P79_022169 [Pimephales promelas]